MYLVKDANMISKFVHFYPWQHCSQLRSSLTCKPELAAIILKHSAPLMSGVWNGSSCQELSVWGR